VAETVLLSVMRFLKKLKTEDTVKKNSHVFVAEHVQEYLALG
jgi:hypothetical protein